MKRSLILSVLFFTVCIFYNSFAQERVPKLIVITLDKDNSNLAIPLDAIVNPGDSIQFKTISGDFAIYIENAISIFWVNNVNLKIEVTEASPESEIYVVRGINNDIYKTYSVICTTTKNWPEDAPPRIIIVSQ